MSTIVISKKMASNKRGKFKHTNEYSCFYSIFFLLFIADDEISPDNEAIVFFCKYVLYYLAFGSIETIAPYSENFASF